MTATTEIPGYVAGTWDIDAVHSHVQYTVRHLGIGRSRGRFDSFQGEIVTADDPLDSTVTASIDVKSLSSGNGTRDSHVLGGDFFAVDEFPTAEFRSTGIRADGADWIVDGEFTLRGVTKPVSLQVELGGFVDGIQGGTVLGLYATTTIDRTEFGVGAPGGAIVSEDVKIELDIEAALRS